MNNKSCSRLRATITICMTFLLFLFTACNKDKNLDPTNVYSVNKNEYQAATQVPSQAMHTKTISISNSPTQVFVSPTSVINLIPPAITVTPVVKELLVTTTPAGPITPSTNPTIVDWIVPAATAIPDYLDWVLFPRGNTLFIKHDRSYEVVNKETMMRIHLALPQYSCPYKPLSDLQVVCKSNDDQLLLYNLITGEETFLGVKSSFGFTQQDQKIYFIDKGLGEGTLYALDLDTRIISEAVPKVNVDNWGYPLPVDHGKHFIVGKADGHLYQIEPSGREHLIGSIDQYVGQTYAVSPAGPIVAYGASNLDLEKDPGSIPSDAYIADFDTGETRHIDLSVQYQGILFNTSWPKWSTDGRQLAILLDYWVCIYNINTRQDKCVEVKDEGRFYGSHTMTWSPDDKYLAFDIDAYRLAILNIDSMDVFTLEFIEGIEDVFWK